MLLEFKTKNYKLFKEEVIFSMLPAPKQTGLDYSVLEEKYGENKLIKGLCSSVVYGANASGKTNIIGAMDVLKSIILNGNIRNSKNGFDPNQAKYFLELIPNKSHLKKEPTELYIDFIENGLRIQYSIKFDLGRFLESEFPRKILLEELFINKIKVFSRKKNKVSLYTRAIDDYLVKGIDEVKKIEKYAGNTLESDELFLCNAFRFLISKNIYETIYNYFSEKFFTLYSSNLIEVSPILSESNDDYFINKEMNDSIRLLGGNNSLLCYYKNDNNQSILGTIIHKKSQEDKGIVLSADSYESFGTIRFANLFPLIMKTITVGGTLIIDEFDASIHPSAILSIINIFHNDDININKAQLIFNTHNPLFLNSNVFRRDEIKFVEREKEGNSSVIYSLADFGTKGMGAVRKNEDFMKQYFNSKYGGIREIDFSSIFESVMEHGKRSDYE